MVGLKVGDDIGTLVRCRVGTVLGESVAFLDGKSVGILVWF